MAQALYQRLTRQVLPDLVRRFVRRPVGPIALPSRVRNRRIRSQFKVNALLRRQLVKRSDPCRGRAVRRSVMFAAGVAGRGWGSGGPNMLQARRSEFSNATCKR